MEYLGPHVRLVARICLLLSVLALAWLVLWRATARTWRVSTTADAAFVAVLLFVITSRVISPQYMVWLVGLAAVCALHFGPGGDSVMRLPAVLVLIATALSCVEYPYYFQELLAAERGAVHARDHAQRAAGRRRPDRGHPALADDAGDPRAPRRRRPPPTPNHA